MLYYNRRLSERYIDRAEHIVRSAIELGLGRVGCEMTN